MEITTNDCLDELVTTEHLVAFSVVEHYCDQCSDLTPHHIEDTQKELALETDVATLVPPLSVHECVICREEEESKLAEFSS